MTGPAYTPVLQALHVDGGWLAFGLAPVALLVRKGSRLHVWAGRGFLLALVVGIGAGLVLSIVDRAVGLFFYGLLTLFLLGTGYLAPRIGRGSQRWYRWDRVLTAVGIVGSIGLVAAGSTGGIALWEGLSFGALGLAITLSHALWRGPRDPSRWQVEHLTSLLGAYTIGWSFILALYAGLQDARGLVVPALGIAAILWARRRFRSPATPTPPGT